MALALLASAPLQAKAAKYRFCAGESQHEGVMCSLIKYSIPYVSAKFCKAWAMQNNVNYLGSFSDSNRARLEEKQRDICDYLPGLRKWSCFVIEDCGMSSSLSPIGVQVFAPSGDVEQARDACVNVGWNIYKQKLIDVSHGCKIAPDAAELAF